MLLHNRCSLWINEAALSKVLTERIFMSTVGVQRAAAPWRTVGIKALSDILFRLGPIANALTQCSA